MNNTIKKVLKILYNVFFKNLSIVIQKFFRTVDEQNFYISKALVVNQVHQETFKEYKNKYNGKEIAIIATAPSLNNYKPIPNTINIGVNKAFLFKKIKMDYIFMMDYNNVKDYIEQLGMDKYKDITKFYAIYPETIYGLKEKISKKLIIPETIAIKHNAKRYYVYSCTDYKNPARFFLEIDKTWIKDGGSTVFPALQFALFTNPKRIYLVGCDCSTGHFDDKKNNYDFSQMIKTWKCFKEFADLYYPGTEIISVNPVGLKGLFKDLYQE